MTTILIGSRRTIFLTVICILELIAVAQTAPATERSDVIAVFINEGRNKIQVDVISADKTDKIKLILPTKAIERTLFRGGHVELYTPSKNTVSGRLLATRALPTPISAPEFFDQATRTFYFRVLDAQIMLVRPKDLTSKERRWLEERSRIGW